MHKHAKRWTASLLAVMMILSCVLTGCSSSEPEETPDDTEVEELSSEIELSSPDYDFDAEFFYGDYNARSNADTEYQDGIDTFDTKDIVFENMQFDEFNYLLNSEGTYLIMFGGSWSHNTRAAVPYINELAKEYGITTVYNFDFYLDGTDPNTNICEDVSVEEYAGAAYNYLYGELVSRYLTNLDDWTEYKAGSENDITWYDVNYDEHTAARVQVPFLFLYNKDNTTYNYLDENGEVQQGTAESGKTYPIIYAFEELVDRDSNGVYVTDESGNREYITEQYQADLEQLFLYVKDNNISVDTYTDAQYMYEGFVTGNGRGHAEKLFDVFTADEQINLETVSYRGLQWLLEQEGDAVILFAGCWCANSAAAIGLINDNAVANNVKIYVFDNRLDGKYPIDFWGYGRDRQIQIRETTVPDFEGKATEEYNPWAYLYVDRINTYLTNITCSSDDVISYPDENGNLVSAAKAMQPFLFAYNKDAVDEDGFPAPVLATHEVMLEITESSLESGSYTYLESNYNTYNEGTANVINAYMQRLGREAQMYSGEPRQELVAD